MRAIIQQFMWGNQSYFRWWLESFAQGALSSIGVETAPAALLVGLSDDETVTWPICIEPETGRFKPTDLAEVELAAQQAREVDPRRNVLIGDAEQDAAYRRGLLEDCRKEAIKQALSAIAPEDQRMYFVGDPGRINGYRIYPVLSVIAPRWAAYPALEREQESSRIHTRRSLQEALLAKILQAATDLLSKQVAPNGFEFDDQLREDLIRHAARDFVSRLAFVHGEWDSSAFGTAMDAVSALPYEGRTGAGTVILAKEDHADLETAVKFKERVPLRNTRAFRKALEMSGIDLHLLSDGVSAYGLGHIAPSYHPDDESIYAITIVGRGSWELAHFQTPLMRSDYGIVRLPKERIAEETFVDTVERIYGAAADVQALWALVLTAADQQHGTMLVIHSDAAGEALRLAPQALAVEPRYLEVEALRSLTSIDGAVLVSPDGACHAVGVILDGTAIAGAGDPARGARYNSAVRYHSAAASGTCVIVIVSEDGMINLLPELRVRVKRTALESAVVQLEEAVSAENPDFELIGAADRRIDSLSFYFDAAQCNRINAARDKTNEIRKAANSFVLVEVPHIAPSSDMNHEYFLPEASV